MHNKKWSSRVGHNQNDDGVTLFTFTISGGPDHGADRRDKKKQKEVEEADARTQTHKLYV